MHKKNRKVKMINNYIYRLKKVLILSPSGDKVKYFPQIKQSSLLGKDKWVFIESLDGSLMSAYDKKSAWKAVLKLHEQES